MIEAIITGAVAITVCMLNNLYQSRQAAARHEKTISLIEYRLDELTKKVELHNKVVERTYKLEEQASLTTEKLAVVNHRIADLESAERK